MESSTTIYDPLIARIKADVVSGRYAPGTMLGTEIGLAADTGISRTSVRKAINDLIAEGLVYRRAGKGIFAREAPPGTRVVELVVPDLGHLWAQVANGAQENGKAQRIKLQIYSANMDLEADIRTIRSLPSSGVDGAIIGAMHHAWMNNAFVQLWQAGFPFVLCDQRMQDIDVPSVVFDSHRAGYIATQELIRLGHRRIAFVGFEVPRLTGSRADGYRDALNDAGILFDRSLTLIHPLDVPPQKLGLEEFLSLLRTRPDRPTAIVFHTEHLAMTAYPLFKKMGVRIPDDISAVAICTDDLANLVAPTLATVTLPSREMGQAAIEILLKRLQDPTGPVEHRVLPVTWEPRDSVAAR